jgi:hypothetical protein
VGLYQRAPFNSVTFVNNHDLDAKNTRILNNMPLAYAMAATVPGLFGIYVKDWLEKLGYGYDDKLITMCGSGILPRKAKWCGAGSIISLWSTNDWDWVTPRALL